MSMTIIDSYRIELFTNSKEAAELRHLLNSSTYEPYIKYKEHSHGGGSIFLINAPMSLRGWMFDLFQTEKWFAMEGGIVRNVDTWVIESY